MMLSADRVLVIVGTPCSMSAVGSTETYQARVVDSPEFIAHAAFDAGLVDFDAHQELRPRWLSGAEKGQPASLEEIEKRHGQTLRANMGIRRIDTAQFPASNPSLDLAAPLPHDLESGGLLALTGMRYHEIRASSFREMHGLFDADPRLGPSMQSQLFLYAGLGALAALPVPLAKLIDNPYEFKVAAGTCFAGMDSLSQWMNSANEPDQPRDRFASRLAGSLASHGPALLSTMLAPSYGISRMLNNPELLDSLWSESTGYMRVPQSPLTVTGACSASLVAFTSVATSMVFDYPGIQPPRVALWSSADTAVQPNLGVVDAFGPGAMMSSAKLNVLNEGRPEGERRSIADSLAPFDRDANGTVVGNAGSAVLVTTLDFAIRNFLDITAVVVGWGQSGESGGKAHFAGVGFGGENAIIAAYDMAYQGHGYGVQDFDYFAAHATGTRTNSRTDLASMASARRATAERQAFKGTLPRMKVGAHKSLGDGHSMGETGLKSASQAIQYLLGKPAVGVPTLRSADPELGEAANGFVLQSTSVRGGGLESGAICAAQGFGGYNGAIAMRAASPASLSRYGMDEKVLAEYLERWPQIRREREQRETAARRRRGAALELAQLHRWQGPQ
jgi:3-oxoacyl-[acyl-carrier-protein] synthase II